MLVLLGLGCCVLRVVDLRRLVGRGCQRMWWCRVYSQSSYTGMSSQYYSLAHPMWVMLWPVASSMGCADCAPALGQVVVSRVR